jgi:DNA-binding transcriptional ArsR family regulator
MRSAKPPEKTNRTIQAVSIAVLVALLGIAVTGLATDYTGPGEILDGTTFGVPSPHIGDQGVYLRWDAPTGTFLGPEEDPASFFFEWLEPQQTIAWNLDHRWTHNLRLVGQDDAFWNLASHDETILGDWTLWFDRSSGELVATSTYDDPDPWLDPGIMQDQLKDRDSRYTRFIPDLGTLGRFMSPCLVQNPFQGATIDLSTSDGEFLEWDPFESAVRVDGRGHVFFYMPCQSSKERGLATHTLSRFEHWTLFQDNGYRYLELWSDQRDGFQQLRFREDIPYPVQFTVEEKGTGEPLVYALSGFRQGEHALPGPGPDQPSMALDFKEPPVWGIDDSGIDHPYPLNQAWDDATSLPHHEDFQSFLAENPDAQVADVRFFETDVGTHMELAWRITVEADGDIASACPSRSTTIFGPSDLPAPLETLTWAGNDCLGNPWAQALDHSIRPTVASMMQVWERLASPHGLEDEPRHYRFYWSGEREYYKIGHRYVEGNTPVEGALGYVEPQAMLQRDQMVYFDDGGNLSAIITSDFQRQTGPPGSFDEPSNASQWSVESFSATAVWGFPGARDAMTIGIFSLLLAIIYWAWPYLKAALPLFSRIDRPKVLENKRRARVAGIIDTSPGIHFSELLRRSGLARGTLQHHLQKLVETEIITKRQEGGYTTYHPTGKAGPAVSSSGRSETAKRILTALETHPDTTAAQLARELGLSRQVVHYHLRKIRPPKPSSSE